MKSFKLSMLTLLFILFVIPVHLSGTTINKPVTSEATVPLAPEEIAVLNNRLLEIEEMDMSALSRNEKRALRSEVRSIKGELKNNSDGVYLSVGALLLVIVLLIILL
jgi:hypothetical protein